MKLVRLILFFMITCQLLHAEIFGPPRNISSHSGISLSYSYSNLFENSLKLGFQPYSFSDRDNNYSYSILNTEILYLSENHKSFAYNFNLFKYHKYWESDTLSLSHFNPDKSLFLSNSIKVQAMDYSGLSNFKSWSIIEISFQPSLYKELYKEDSLPYLIDVSLPVNDHSMSFSFDTKIGIERLNFEESTFQKMREYQDEYLWEIPLKISPKLRYSWYTNRLKDTSDKNSILPEYDNASFSTSIYTSYHYYPINNFSEFIYGIEFHFDFYNDIYNFSLSIEKDKLKFGKINDELFRLKFQYQIKSKKFWHRFM